MFPYDNWEELFLILRQNILVLFLPSSIWERSFWFQFVGTIHPCEKSNHLSTPLQSKDRTELVESWIGSPEMSLINLHLNWTHH